MLDPATWVLGADLRKGGTGLDCKYIQTKNEFSHVETKEKVLSFGAS